MDLGNVAGTVIGLGLAVEVLVKFLRHGFDVNDKAPMAWWTAIAIALGLASAYAFGVNIFKGPDISASKLSALWGQTLTGFSIGGGSGLLHSIMASWGNKSTNPKGLTPTS